MYIDGKVLSSRIVVWGQQCHIKEADLAQEAGMQSQWGPVMGSHAEEEEAWEAPREAAQKRMLRGWRDHSREKGRGRGRDGKLWKHHLQRSQVGTHLTPF